MALKIPRLSTNRHGVFYIRVYFFDQSGKRRLKQHSLRTKDCTQARVLALRFNLEFETRCQMERKKIGLEALLDAISNPLKHTASDGESIDFDPSNPAELAFAKQWKQDKDQATAKLKQQVQSEGRDLTLLEAISGKLVPDYAKPLQKSKPFSEATALYLQEKTLDNKKTTLAEKRRTYQDFIATFGDLAINRITKQEIVAWKSKDITRGLTANRINKRLGQVNDFFNWACNNGHYTASDKSPVDGVFISNKAKIGKATENREPFTDDDIKNIFGTGYIKRFFAPDHYWIPLACLFSGARREEVGDLLSKNVTTVDGVPTFQIEEGKNKNARRRVPIHQTLIDLGFMDYAEARQASGHAQLFPHRPKGMGGRAKEAGRMFSLRLRKDCAIPNTRKTFHSLRHTVITRLHATGANTAHVMQIAGHSDEAQGVHFQTYTHSIGLKELAKTLNRLVYPHNFDAVKVLDPTFNAFFRQEKTAEVKQAERVARNAEHLKAKAAREPRNRDARAKNS